jgi:hypothetical protein
MHVEIIAEAADADEVVYAIRKAVSRWDNLDMLSVQSLYDGAGNRIGQVKVSRE